MNDRYATGLALINYLTNQVALSAELRPQILHAYDAKQIGQAVSYCRELYHIGTQDNHSALQAVALHYLGAVYFGLGGRASDLDKAIESFQQSAQIFHAALEKNNECSEAVAWLGAAEASAHQWSDFKKDRWQDAIESFTQAAKLFKQKQHRLAALAEDKLRETEFKFSDWLKVTNHVQPLSTTAQPAKPDPSTSALNWQPFANYDFNQFATYGASGFRAVFNFILLIEVGIVFIVAHGALYFLIDRVSEYRNYFLLGYGLALSIVLIRALVLLFAGQLLYHIPRDAVALVNDQGRVWQIEDAGWHLLMPASQNLIGVIARASRKVQLFQREYATTTGCRVSVQIKAEWIIIDAARAWHVVGAAIKPSRLLGIPIPLREKQISEPIEQAVRGLLNEVIKRIAADPAACAVMEDDDPTVPENFARKLLDLQCNVLGVYLKSFSLKVYKN